MKNINKSKQEILKCLKLSFEFYRENDYTWTKVLSSRARIHEIFIHVNNEDITLSEKAGFGLACVIGKINIQPKDQSHCEIIISFQIGIFTVNSLKLLIISLLIILPFAFALFPMAGYFLLLPIIFLGLFVPIKISSMKFILKKVSISLHVDMDWHKIPATFIE